MFSERIISDRNWRSITGSVKHDIEKAAFTFSHRLPRRIEYHHFVIGWASTKNLVFDILAHVKIYGSTNLHETYSYRHGQSWSWMVKKTPSGTKTVLNPMSSPKKLKEDQLNSCVIVSLP